MLPQRIPQGRPSKTAECDYFLLTLLVYETFRFFRSSLALWLCPSMAGGTHGKAGSCDHRNPDQRIWQGGGIEPLERSILVPKPWRRHGDGLAFVGDHDLG